MTLKSQGVNILCLGGSTDKKSLATPALKRKQFDPTCYSKSPTDIYFYSLRWDTTFHWIYQQNANIIL